MNLRDTMIDYRETLRQNQPRGSKLSLEDQK